MNIIVTKARVKNLSYDKKQHNLGLYENGGNQDESWIYWSWNHG